MSGPLVKYFVLKPKGEDEYAQASRVAMRAYAQEIRPTDSKLADDVLQMAIEGAPK